MIHIETRQQQSGLWWCNATIDGYDHSFEDVNISGVQMQMIKFLISNSIFFDMCTWESPQLYSK